MATDQAASADTRDPHPYVAPSPHIYQSTFTTRAMMIDVIIGLAPALIVAVLVFHWYAIRQVGLCVLVCLVAETFFTWLRGKPLTLSDSSATVTGIILGLSFPAAAPWYVAVIASLVAIGLGKAVFGGLGYNIFNPAMVGRAFVMLSFAQCMGASAYRVTEADLSVITQATPMAVAKQYAADLVAGKVAPRQVPDSFREAVRPWPLIIGTVNGSLGETSALALLLGGVYLCIRRSAAWQIPAGCLGAAALGGLLANLAGVSPLTMWQQLLGGALLFGAFFIATDPVSSPLTPIGKWIFGAGIGLVVIVIRVFSGYPEGVMFAVLLMNATVPLINRWTVPRPLGGPFSPPA